MRTRPRSRTAGTAGRTSGPSDHQASADCLQERPPAEDPIDLSTSRLEAFSDGFFAVIITILALELRPPAGLPRLRDFLRWLVRSGQPVYGEIIEQVIDVDRAEDVALAETLALAGRVS